ncbi:MULTISPECIES: zinc-binding dehydrogenase [unclassified Burkholderia]|uniref:zinc-binding dehydrogenase n=1 Tax=unclassified Burkholderia TaxID=2613784 RepID=UPI002892AF97|nr:MULTISPECIES: zinc-binding dehydrogenase [unclassified Burkholderia]
MDILKLPAGGTIAVIGAAGAVGGYTVQLATAEGFRVIADASPKDIQLVEALGADVVLRRGSDFPDLVRNEVPDGVDGLIDTAGVGLPAARAVRNGGRITTSAPGTPLLTERDIVPERTFVPKYALNHSALKQPRQ